MNIYNVEFNYAMKYIPIKVHYLQKRFPTYIEFFVYSILLNYPNREKSLKEVLSDDFNIIKQELFERALEDLILIKCINIDNHDYNFSSKLLSLPISNFTVAPEIKKSIDSGDFGKSIIPRVEPFRVYFDDFQNKWEVVRENYWSKKIASAKFIYNLDKNKDSIKNVDIEQIKDECLRMLSIENREINNDDLVGFFIDNNEAIENLNIKEIVANERIAFELFITFDEEQKTIDVICEDKNVQNKINSDLKLKENIFINILEDYSEKTKEKILPIDVHDINNILNTLTPIGLFSEIDIKANYDLCLINGHYINIFKKIIEENKLFKNVKYLIVYNSKTNIRKLDRINNMVIFYTDQLSNQELLQSSITFMNTSESTTYYILNKKIINNLQIPYLYKKNNIINNLRDICLEEERHFAREFDNVLSEARYKELNDLIEILSRIGLQDWVEKKIHIFIKENIFNAFAYNQIIDNLNGSSQTCKKLFERVLLNCFKEISQTRGAEEIIKLILTYKISSTKQLVNLLESLDYNWNWKNLISIITYLEKLNFDPWAADILSCVELMLEHYLKNQKLGLYSADDHESYVWKNHAVLVNSYSILMKSLYQNNFIDCWQAYNQVIDYVIPTIGQSIKISKNPKKYIKIIAQLLNNFYEYYNSEKNNENMRNQIDLDQYAVRKIKVVKVDEYIKKINTTMDKYLNSDDEKILPVELKYEYIINVLNIDDEEIEKINYNFSDIIKALKIKYGSM